MRLLLVEDDTKLVRALTLGLEREGYVVDAAESGDLAMELARATDYEGVVLDLMLPGIDGFTVCRQLRSEGRWMPVLMLTARTDVTDRIRGLDAGADDYLTKPYDPGELLARLRAVQRRSGAGESMVQLGSLQIDLANDLVRRDGVPIVLTQKEWALLRVMAMRPERIHTREALQDALYGFDEEADSNTLEVFVSRLRRKLGREHIQTLRGLGYRLAFHTATS